MSRFFKQSELVKPSISFNKMRNISIFIIISVSIFLLVYGCNMFFDYYRLKFQVPTPVTIEKRSMRVEKILVTPTPTKVIKPTEEPEPTIDPFSIPAQPAQ